MNILALDTSTKFLCIGIEFKGQIKGYRIDLQKKLSEKLIPLLSRIFKRSKLELKNFDLFCVGIGPGSFTGLRIGLATIKGFCFALGKRLVCIPSLDIIANNVTDKESLICPIVDAKRNLVYTSLYRKDYKGLKRLSKYLLISIGDLLKMISGSVIFTGDGILLYRDYLKKKLEDKAFFLSEEFWYPKPDSLISLAKERIERKRFSDPDRISPFYLYSAECQIKK